MKRTVITLALIIALSIPASGVSACGRNYHSRHHHHHFFQKHHAEVQPQTEAQTYAYYHDVLGKSKAWYLINIHKLP